MISYRISRRSGFELTGMPQLVDIPAPVNTMTFLADARVLAMF